MTVTPLNRHPSIPCPEKNDKRASENTDEGPTWLTKMPMLNEPKELNQKAYPAADESSSNPTASSTATKAKSSDDDARLQEVGDIGHGQTNLSCAMQLSPVPGLSPVDLPLSAQIEKTAAIQQAALARMRAAQGGATERPSPTGKTTLLGCIKDGAIVAPADQTDRYATFPAIERPKFNQLPTSGPTVNQSHHGLAAATARKVRGTILATSILSMAAVCIPFNDWRPLLTLAPIVQASSYVLKRLPNASSNSELKLSRDFEPENSFRSGKSPEQTSVQQSATSLANGATGAVKPSATLLHTTDEQLDSDQVKPLLANAGQALGVEAKSQSARQIEAEGKEIGAVRETVATVQPTAPRSLQKNPRYLDPQEVKVLIVRGKQLMDTGDVVAARGMFLRAAEAEDPEAAVALGATYDPSVLRGLGVIGIVADLENARAWYEKAEKWGSREARRRLEALKR